MWSILSAVNIIYSSKTRSYVHCFKSTCKMLNTLLRTMLGASGVVCEEGTQSSAVIKTPESMGKDSYSFLICVPIHLHNLSDIIELHLLHFG